MATAFSSLYSAIRTQLGDVSTLAKYSNAQLDLALQTALLEDRVESASLYAESPSGSITPTLADDTDMLRVVVRSALALIRPSSGVTMIRTPVSTITRDAKSSLVSVLQRKLDLLVTGGTAVDGDTVVDIYRDGDTKFLNHLANGS